MATGIEEVMNRGAEVHPLLQEPGDSPKLGGRDWHSDTEPQNGACCQGKVNTHKQRSYSVDQGKAWPNRKGSLGYGS